MTPDDDLDIALITMTFRASDIDALLAVLAKYVVMTRNEPGCRNVDLCASMSDPATVVVIEKWDTAERARSHFDAPVMVEMAQHCTGILTGPPDIDLLEGISAHDLA